MTTKNSTRLSFLLTMLTSFCLHAQQMSMDQAVQTALKNNLGIKAAEYQVDYFRELKKSGTDIGKTSLNWMHGQYNSFFQDNNVTVSQSIPFPGTLIHQVRLGEAQVRGAEQNLTVQRNNLAYDVKTVYLQLLHQQALNRLLLSQDSLYADFVRAAVARYQAGEGTLLEKTTAETQQMELRNQRQQNEADISIFAARLQALLKVDEPVQVGDELSKRRISNSLDTVSLAANPMLEWWRRETEVSRRAKLLERSRILPDLTVGWFGQSLTGWQTTEQKTDIYYPRSKVFSGFQVGVALPLWIKPNLARAKAMSYQEAALRKSSENYEKTLEGNFIQARRELEKNSSNIRYYENSALQNAALLLSQARKAFRSGEIGYLEYLQAVRNSHTIRNGYLSALLQYNLSVVKLEFLSGII